MCPLWSHNYTSYLSLHICCHIVPLPHNESCGPCWLPLLLHWVMWSSVCCLCLIVSKWIHHPFHSHSSAFFSFLFCYRFYFPLFSFSFLTHSPPSPSTTFSLFLFLTLVSFFSRHFLLLLSQLAVLSDQPLPYLLFHHLLISSSSRTITYIPTDTFT